MNISLFIDADTCYKFNSRERAFDFAIDNNIKSFCLLTEYDSKIGKNFSIYNTFVSKTEWFYSETSALMYIGSFL